MSRRALQHLFCAWIAMAMVLIVPSWARAAIVPTCDSRDLLSILSPEPSHEPLCASASPATNDDGPELKVAAMCDERGASAIAPQHVTPVSDAARIEAGGRCGLVIGGTAHIDLSPKNASPTSDPGGTLERAVLEDFEIPTASFFELLPAYAPVLGFARPGIERGVFRPPRA